MRVLVTGGAGFIGSHVCEELLKQGHQVCVVFDKTKPGKIAHIVEEVEFIRGDIRKLEDCEWAVQGIESVIHLAALINVNHSIQTPMPFYETNVLGTVNLLEAVRREQAVKKFTYMSTFEVYGEILEGKATEEYPVDPRSPYGASKYAAERYCLSFNASFPKPEISVVRGANTFGPRQSYGVRGGVIAIFIVKALNGQPLVIYGDGLQTRDYVYVKDLARGIVKVATTYGLNGEIINLCTGNEISIREIAEKILYYTGFNVEVIFDKPRPGENRRSVGDNSKALRLLNWSPAYSFKHGLYNTVRWYRLLYKLGIHRL